MTKETIEYVKANFVVDIIHNDNGYVHAYIHNKNGEYSCSFNIQTSPEMLFYYGDLGAFVFKRDGQDSMLRFFNRIEPDFFYWEEKCVAGDVKRYSADTARRSFLECFASELNIGYDDDTSDDEILKEIEHLFDRYDDYCDNEDDNADFSDVEEVESYLRDRDDFEEALESLDDEELMGCALAFLDNECISHECFETDAYTKYFDRCLWSLSIFTGKILELIKV